MRFIVFFIITLFWRLNKVGTEVDVPAKESGILIDALDIIDGDTISFDETTNVRYLGINTPETHHPDVGVECFAGQTVRFM